VENRTDVLRIPTAETKPLLTPPEVAAILRVGKNTVYDLIRSGQLPAFKVGRSYKVPTAELRKFVGLPPGSNLDRVS
jgi:excisionase family DNA binding protein